MTLLWPLLGNALLLAAGSGFFVGAKVNARLPLPQRQFESIIGMLYNLDERWMQELADYYRERDAWRRGEPLYPTGAYAVVPEPIYGEERSKSRVEVSAPTRTEQEAPQAVAPRRTAGRRRAPTGGKPSVGSK